MKTIRYVFIFLILAIMSPQLRAVSPEAIDATIEALVHGKDADRTIAEKASARQPACGAMRTARTKNS